MKLMDTDGNGEIDQNEFLEAVVIHTNRAKRLIRRIAHGGVGLTAVEAFRRADEDGNGDWQS